MWVTLVVGAVVFVFPFVWMLAMSVKPEGQAITYPPTLLPHNFELATYTSAGRKSVWASSTSTPLRLLEPSPFFRSRWTLWPPMHSQGYSSRVRNPVLDRPRALMVPVAVLIVPLFLRCTSSTG